METRTLQIKKEFSCDVLVVGGGVSGIAAAVAAAPAVRHGISPKAVDAKELTDTLRSQGVYLG